MRRLTLRARLALLVLAGVVPFLVFNLGSSYLSYRHIRIESERRMLDAARGIALAMEGELRSRMSILEVLALSVALARNDLDAFRTEAEVVRARQEPGTHILLLREDGQQLLNTAVAPGEPLPVRANLDSIRRVFSTERPAVSDVFVGRVLKRPIVALEVPVLGPDGRARLVLSMTPMLDAFDGVIRRQRGDENWLTAIIDRTGRRVARFPADERLAAPVQSAAFMKVWKPGLEGTMKTVPPSGEQRLLGYSPIPDFGWTVVVGASATEPIRLAWRSAAMTATVGFALLMFGVGLAHQVSRSVSVPIAKLGRLASAWSENDDPALLQTGLRETDDVAAILLTDARVRAAALADQARYADALKASNQHLAEEIATRQAAEAALMAAKETAEQASQTKSRFLTNITHELRTPLHGILGYAELLSLDGGLNPTQSMRVAAMIAAGEHLLGMINSVLDVSQIEAGRLELHLEKINLADLARTCLDVVRPAAEAKGLALVLSAAMPAHVRGDITRLRQVLVNLLGNAIKFTPSGGVELRLAQSAAGDCIRLEVADTGPGIWARHRDKLFQTFERLNASAVAGIEGTGLGLALAAQLVRAMDGRIGYQDNPGGGSIFWVELPAVQANPAQTDVAATDGMASRPGRRLLVVDDDALNRDIAARFLTLGGHEVQCVDSGAAAVAAARSEDFDVILMDVRMPGMNGLEATRLIRLIPGPRGKVPVIALTAQAFTEQIEICRRAGMNTHVSKPFTQAVLLAAIEATAAANQVQPIAGSQDGADETDPEIPVFNRAAFEDIAGCLSAAEASDQLQALIARGEALMGGLRAPWMADRAGELADAAHKLAGGAAMLGFLWLAHIGRRFEYAADSGAPETPALAQQLGGAIAASIAIMRRELAEMAAVAG